MLFNPKPKEDPKDLFDREKEIEKLRFGINYPMTLLLGIRRSGKSSLVKVLMKEEKGIWLYLDLRKFESSAYISYKDIIQELEKSINTSLPERLKKVFAGVKGVNFVGVNVIFNWGKERIKLAQILDKLSEIAEKEGERIIIIFDESQELRKLKGVNLLYPIAYAFDNLKVRFIFTGSEIGMVYDFLKLDKPDSPLYGRAYTEVNVPPFSKETSLEFLRKGFEEFKIKVEERELEDAVNTLGGIPGWLTYYGFNYIQEKDHEKALNKTVETAISLIKKEFNNFLKGREGAKERYKTIMTVYKNGCKWKEAKIALEAKEGVRIDDKRFTQLLNNLVKASFLIKEGEIYKPTDVLIEKAFS
ncbi:ATP-binding protein [Acidianus brierleyi]|uniref:AAA family ATPase n=1 Tax=Acidianus brierleyi TaxID=41673 RepID=A0A2U9IJ41_9CREN|nr:ATP-binding protein [Acidianus brierleyi]